MNRPHKILMMTIAAIWLMASSLLVLGQSTSKHPDSKTKINIGFRSGREYLFNSSSLVRSKQNKVHTAVYTGLVLRKPINEHFKAEAGIDYNVIQNQCCINNSLVKKAFKVSVPISVQCYLMPQKCKLQPYFGAGVQGNLYSKNYSLSPFTSTEGRNESGTNTPSIDTKYISILFTQGVTFEINTKIQINESFHFMPNNNYKTFGIDVGIGFTIP